MKIKGLVWGAALFAPLALNGGLRAAEVDLTSMLDEAVAQTSCCESDECAADCCDACDCGDGCGCFAPHWFAAAEFMFVGVDTDFGRGNVYYQALPGDVSRVTDGYNDFTYAPRLTLGRQLTENWGVQTRFFYLNDEESATDGVLDLANAPSFAFGRDTQARMYSIDVEAVRRLGGDLWKVDATAGVRHASLDLNSDLSGVGFPAINTLQIGESNVGSSFEGTGLTGALIGRRQIGSSNASLFTSARGSVLFGDSETNAAAYALATNGAITEVVSDLDANSEATTMLVTELSIGIQWDFALRYMPANAFFRTAFEYQNWNVDGDLGSNAAAVAGGPLPIFSQTTVGASSGPAEVDLYGLVIGAGFTW